MFVNAFGGTSQEVITGKSNVKSQETSKWSKDQDQGRHVGGPAGQVTQPSNKRSHEE